MTCYDKAEQHTMTVDDEGQQALDDVFSSSRDRGADSAAPAPKVEETPPPTPETAPEAKTADEGAAPEAKEGEPKGYRDPETGRFVPLKELTTERGRRQEEARLRAEAEQKAAVLEARYQELQRLVAAQQQHQQQPQQQFQQPQAPQAPDPYTDPAGYAAFIQEQTLAQVRQTIEAERHQAFLSDLYRDEARLKANATQFPDMEKTIGAFTAAAARDPSLRQAMQTQGRYAPAEFAYRMGRQILAQERIGADPDAYEKRVREEERAKVIAELKQGGTSPPVRFPGTLSDAPGAGNQTTAVSDQQMLDSIYDSGRHKRRA